MSEITYATVKSGGRIFVDDKELNHHVSRVVIYDLDNGGKVEKCVEANAREGWVVCMAQPMRQVNGEIVTLKMKRQIRIVIEDINK